MCCYASKHGIRKTEQEIEEQNQIRIGKKREKIFNLRISFLLTPLHRVLFYSFKCLKEITSMF